MAYYKNKCIGCGECVSVCPSGAHKITEEGHVFERALCIGCGKCEKACLGEALKFYGTEMTVIKFAEPLFACIFGAILLGENIFKLQYLAAFALISLGIILGNKSDKLEEKDYEKSVTDR